jgi:hypothetical protein
VLESVDIGRQSIGDYEATAGREAVERLRILAESLNITCANPVPWSRGPSLQEESRPSLCSDLSRTSVLPRG